MNNRIIYETYNCFYKNGFSVIRINFRGVKKSDGIFDNGQGELSDAAAALDWIEKENPDYSQCWVSGFSFGALICMQLIMRRPEVNKFIAISPQPNVYDFTFLAPCPISGLVMYGKNDELVSQESISGLVSRLKKQKNIDVKFETILNANHFYKNKEKELSLLISSYLKDKVAIL
jgi:alpha/beta superfamily hydrolase